MARKENIVSYSAAEIERMLAEGEDRTDYGREVSAEEIERQIASDPALVVPDNWEELAFRGVPAVGKENKRLVSMRYSPRVIDYFKSTGRGWQTRMDAVLMAFVDRQERKQR